MSPIDLSDEMLNAVHAGAEPVPRHDRKRYYNIIAAWLDECPLLTHHGLRDAIREAQRQLLRSSAVLTPRRQKRRRILRGVQHMPQHVR